MLARVLGLVMGLFLCVLSMFDASRYCIETAARIDLVWAYRLPSTYLMHTLCFKEIMVSAKIRVVWYFAGCPKLWTSKTWPRRVHWRRVRRTSDSCRIYSTE